MKDHPKRMGFDSLTGYSLIYGAHLRSILNLRTTHLHPKIAQIIHKLLQKALYFSY